MKEDRPTLSPKFLNVHSAITRPDEIVVTTRYFWKRWAPKIGPIATTVLIALRRRCYLNRESGEERDVCFPRIPDLALEVGIHRTTVIRALAQLESFGFLERTKRYRSAGGVLLSRMADRYRVLLEDPISPEDKNRAEALQLELGGPIGREERPNDRIDTYGAGEAVTSMISDRSLKAIDRSVAQSDHKRPLLEADANNVPTLGNGGRQGRKGEIGDPRIALIVQDAEEILGDRKSRGFLINCASRLPEDVVRQALSETKQASREGRIRGSRGAYFVGIVKRQADELGVSIMKGGPSC